MLVADALRLGGAILGNHPNMLAPQLVGRLLPEIEHNNNVRMLLRACDNDGIKDCSLMPLYHCLHTPGGPLKVIYEKKKKNPDVIFLNLQYFYKLILVFSGRSSIRCVWVLPNI